jgi:Cys-rich four helix bundle protein (predicted Tat secretion target)
MNRRDWLVGAGAVALAAAAQAAPKEKPAPEGGNPLLDATFDCQKKAEACLTHCMTMFAAGDTSMAGCAAAVRETIATSRALASLAAANSKHTKELAKVCADVCKDCEAECRKHQAKMSVCRECADACARMIQEIARLS